MAAAAGAVCGSGMLQQRTTVSPAARRRRIVVARRWRRPIAAPRRRGVSSLAYRSRSLRWPPPLNVVDPRRRPGQAHALGAAEGAAPAGRPAAGRARARRRARACRRARSPWSIGHGARSGARRRLPRPTSRSCRRIRRAAPATRRASRWPRCRADGVTLVDRRCSAGAGRRRCAALVEHAQRGDARRCSRRACRIRPGSAASCATRAGEVRAIVEEQDADADAARDRRDQHRLHRGADRAAAPLGRRAHAATTRRASST